MIKLLVVCLGVVLSWPASETFILADRVGEPEARSFFLFSTSAGNYAIRHDGMGEFSSPKGMRRVFNLKVGPRGRIDYLYFLEHEGDLLLLYDVRSRGAYLVRIEQQKRKVRWLTPIDLSPPFQAPIVNGDVVIVNEAIKIGKADGQVRQD